jgi:hypothetical protein
MAPPRCLDSPIAIVGKGARGQDASLLREVLERVPGVERSVDVAALGAARSRDDDEVRVLTDRIQRVELDASKPIEDGADPSVAARGFETR